MNINAETSYYALPENIADSISAFEPDIGMRRHAYRVADMLIVVLLQKVFDTHMSRHSMSIREPKKSAGGTVLVGVQAQYIRRPDPLSSRGRQ